MHLCAHAAYHLGQAASVRRVVTGDESIERPGAPRRPWRPEVRPVKVVLFGATGMVGQGSAPRGPRRSARGRGRGRRPPERRNSASEDPRDRPARLLRLRPGEGGFRGRRSMPLLPRRLLARNVRGGVHARHARPDARGRPRDPGRRLESDVLLRVRRRYGRERPGDVGPGQRPHRKRSPRDAVPGRVHVPPGVHSTEARRALENRVVPGVLRGVRRAATRCSASPCRPSSRAPTSWAGRSSGPGWKGTRSRSSRRATSTGSDRLIGPCRATWHS